MTPRRVALGVLGFAALLLATLIFALATGPSSVSLSDVVSALRCEAVPEQVADIVSALRCEPVPEHVADIVLRVRLPRVLLGVAVGAALAVAGVLFQALLRNPLADPFVLGVSGGAALGGMLMLSLGAGFGLGYTAVPPAAFAGALFATLLLYAVAGARGRLSPTQMLLTGVVFNAFASAAIVFLASLAGLTEGASLFLWLIGSLAAPRPEIIGWVYAFLAIGLFVALSISRSLDLLTLGEDSAAQLGVDVQRLQRVALLATSVMVGAAVSAAGLIGFVGLIVPHLLRLLIGPDHRLLVPSAALAGASFLLLCDTLARSLPGGRELPVGAVTAVAGGPFFLWLLRRAQSRGAGV